MESGVLSPEYTSEHVLSNTHLLLKLLGQKET